MALDVPEDYCLLLGDGRNGAPGDAWFGPPMTCTGCRPFGLDASRQSEERHEHNPDTDPRIDPVRGHLIDGTHAEFVRVPFVDTSTHRVPDGAADGIPATFARANDTGALKVVITPGDNPAR